MHLPGTVAKLDKMLPNGYSLPEKSADSPGLRGAYLLQEAPHPPSVTHMPRSCQLASHFPWGLHPRELLAASLLFLETVNSRPNVTSVGSSPALPSTNNHFITRLICKETHTSVFTHNTGLGPRGSGRAGRVTSGMAPLEAVETEGPHSMGTPRPPPDDRSAPDGLLHSGPW